MGWVKIKNKKNCLPPWTYGGAEFIALRAPVEANNMTLMTVIKRIQERGRNKDVWECRHTSSTVVGGRQRNISRRSSSGRSLIFPTSLISTTEARVSLMSSFSKCSSADAAVHGMAESSSSCSSSSITSSVYYAISLSNNLSAKAWNLKIRTYID